MAWDDDKSTAADPDNPAPDEQLTADEWDAHVSEGHFPSDELNFGVNADGDPVITDPQNADQVVMRYDRSAGEWVPGGSVNMNGNDVTNIGLADADSASVTDQTITQSYTDPTGYQQSRNLVGAKPIPTPTAYFSGPAHGEAGNAFSGATLAPDGRVVFAPRNSSNVGIFDPSDDSYVSGPAHGEGGDAFRGATLAPDGRVVFAPRYSSNVGIVAQTLEFAVANGGNK